MMCILHSIFIITVYFLIIYHYVFIILFYVWENVSHISYSDLPPIKKNFYAENPEVANMHPEEVEDIRSD